MIILKSIQKKLPLTLVSALVSGMIVAISAPTTATALAPVGVANESVAGAAGVPTNIGVATINGGMPGDLSASAIAVTNSGATAVGRSIGLVALSDIAAGTRTATVRTSGVLSLYWLTATTVAVSASGGAFTSSFSAIAATTVTTSVGTAGATSVAFTLAATGVGNTMATLWTAPSTAGTYYIYARHAVDATVPTAAAPTTGTAFAGITVTVADNTTHPAAGGTNAVDISAATNSSLFVAVANSTGATAVIHPVATLGVGEASAFSKGLLAKNSTNSTAQTATVLAGGVLSLYGVVSTAVAFSATGGTFSSSQAGISDEAVTYNSSNSVSVITGMTPLTGSTGVATLWTAPTTAGTYTISIQAPCFDVGHQQARFYNITDSAAAVLGVSNYTRNGATATSSYGLADGTFTIAGTKVFEVQHRCDVTATSNGFGVEVSWGTEVYTTITINKVA